MPAMSELAQWLPTRASKFNTLMINTDKKPLVGISAPLCITMLSFSQNGLNFSSIRIPASSFKLHDDFSASL